MKPEVRYFKELVSALELFPEEWSWKLADLVLRVRKRRGTLFLAGNGGSHAVAQHWATDFQVARLKTYCLGSNPSRLTAYSNDLGYADGFRNEMAEMLDSEKDALIMLSCSGMSTNIQKVMKLAQAMSMDRYLITSRNLPDRHYFFDEFVLRVGTTDYGVAEDVFAALGHYLTRVLSDEQ